MKKIALTLLLGLGSSTSALADTALGIYAGAGSFTFDVAGTFTDLQSGNQSEVDLEDDLGINGDAAGYYYLAIEHGIPVLPNVRLAHTDMQETGRNILRTEITYDGQTFAEDSLVVTDVDLSHTDLTLYYQLLDNWLNLDLGLTGRNFNGEFVTVGSNSFGSIRATRNLDFAVPLLYGKVQINLPVSGLYVGTEGNGLAYDGSSFYDVWLKAGYEFSFGLGLEAGYRKLQLTLDDVESLETDITFDGHYFAISYHL